MQGIQDVVKKTVGRRFSSFAEMLKQAKEYEKRVYEHPAVKKLQERYPGAHFSSLDLQEYAEEAERCQACTGLSECGNRLQGYRMVVQEDPLPCLVDKNPFALRLAYAPCHFLKADRAQQEMQRLITSHNIPSHILGSTFDTIEMDSGRQQAIRAAIQFAASFERGKTKRGLYLWGAMGVGKSAIAGAVAQALAKRGVDTLMLYWPDFLSEIKGAIKEQNVEEKLRALKEVSVLILDDIGAEALTNWTRDEVFGPVLQYRMERLPTMYTSNLSLQELGVHLTKTREGVDVKKAQRIMERIEPFVHAVEVRGRNRRRELAMEEGVF